VVAEGLAFPEAPRWHDGTLWFSDIFGRRVCRLVGGTVETVARVEARPSGLGWRPDGTTLVVSMTDRRLLALPDDGGQAEEATPAEGAAPTPGATAARGPAAEGATPAGGSAAEGATVVAELASLTGGDCNDMIVDGEGRAYIGEFGYDYAAGAPRSPAALIVVEPDGRARRAADGLWFPNGMAFTDHGRGLLVAETPQSRITAFAVGADGSLSGGLVWAELGDARPDGISLDAAGALWVASPGTGELLRVGEGEVLSVETAPGGMAQACVLGGDDGRTLFVCSSPSHDEQESVRDRSARFYARRVDVPAAPSG